MSLSEKKLSYRVFMDFVAPNGDASRLLSKECYRKWVATRKTPPQHPEESFRRVLTAHVCGLDGRKPFPKQVEANLLPHLRKKCTWPCFQGTEVTIGVRGFRKYGFHESQAMQNEGARMAKRKNSITSSVSSDYKKKSSKKRKLSDALVDIADIDQEKAAKRYSNGSEPSLLLSPGESLNHLELGREYLISTGSFSNLMSQYQLNQLHLQLILQEQMKLLETLTPSQINSLAPVLNFNIKPVIQL